LPTPIPLQRLDPDLPVPAAGRSGDAAVDLPARHDVALEPGQRELVPTGFAVALPPDFCGLILPRSGLAFKHGLTVVNSPGLIDSGYRGEIKVLLLNLGDEPIELFRGDRIAQLLLQNVPITAFCLVDELPASHDLRGEQGFGSSGVATR
jgi:dUTP pyrophosphatase